MPDSGRLDADPNLVTRSEFASRNGWSKSYVSKLGGEGRLVLTEDGKHVLVAESLARIKETSGALERASAPVVPVQVRADRDRKEFYDAEQARLDLEKRVGKLLDKPDVLAVVADAAAALRSRLESFPPRLAPQLAAQGGNEARIKAILADAVEHLLDDLSSRFAKLAELGTED
jgi:hypothetical protein